jgi:integrase/recombinase XerD
MSNFQPNQIPRAQVKATLNAVETSSSDEEEEYTLEEAIQAWYSGKTQATIQSYRRRIQQFQKWLLEEYNRPIDRRLKTKHLKLYFTAKATTCTQLRAMVVCIKSLCRHLYKLKIIKKDVGLTIPDPKQLPPKNERVMTPATVKEFFRLAQTKKNKSTFHLLQILVYGGLRITALSKLKVADVKCDENQKDGEVTKSYKIHIRLGKGGKSRYCPLKRDVGASLYEWAQSLGTTYLFASKKGEHLHPQSLSARIKLLAKKIGKPEISCHYFRHFLASNALHNGGNLVDISKMLGHSSINTTSLYMHSSGANVSELVDLTEDGEDNTVEFKLAKRKKMKIIKDEIKKKLKILKQMK